MPIAKSCDHCRSRKVKCDSAHPPCGACVRRGEDCVYGRDSRFRHGMRRRQGNRTRITEIHSVSRETSDIPVLSTPSNGLTFPTTPYLDDASLVEEGGSHDSDPPGYDILPTTESGIVDQEIHGHNTDAMEMQGHIITDFRNAYCSSSTMTIAPDRPENEAGKARLISNAALRRQQELITLQPRKSMLNINFDNDSNLALHLLNLHWNTIDLPRLVTYRPAFTDSLINGGPYVNKILLNAIYYSSSLNSERGSICSDAGTRYYSRFCQLLRRNADQPSLPTATGLVICATSLLSRGLVRESVEIYSRASQMVAELGIQLRANAREISPSFRQASVEIEKEMQSRLHLGMFALDTLIRLHVGMLATAPPLLVQPSVEILDSFEELEEWVPYIDDSQSSTPTFDPLPTRAVSTFAAQLGLYEILSRILQLFFTAKDSTTYDYGSRWMLKELLENQLESWKQELPHDLQPNLVQDQGYTPHYLALLASYHALRILLQRPFLEQERLRASLSDVRRVLLEDTCIENALEIRRVLTKYREVFSLRRASLMTSFSAYTAFMALKEHYRPGGTSAACVNSIWCMLVELEAGPNPGLKKILMKINRNSESFAPAFDSRSDYATQRQEMSIYDPVANEQRNVADNETDLAEIIEFVNLWLDDGNGCSEWMQDALGMMAGNHMLFDTFRAITKLYFGETTKNMEVANLGQQLYISVLRSVSFELTDWSTNTKIDLLIIVVVLAMLELYRPDAESSMDQHWTASLAILERRGPLRHTTGVAYNIFVDLRYHWVIHFLKARRSSFLCREEWKTIPWQNDPDKKDALQHLLDEVVAIPTLLEQFEQYKSLAATESLSVSENDSMRKSLWAWVDCIRAQLDQWKSRYAAAYPHGSQFKALEANMATIKPVFRCWDSSKMEILTPDPLFYPSMTLAVSLCLYSTACLKLFEVRAPENSSEQNERYTHACNIGLSIPYFFQRQPNPLVLRVMHPLRTAIEQFENGSPERTSLQEMVHLIGEVHHFVRFSSQTGEEIVPLGDSLPDFTVY